MMITDFCMCGPNLAEAEEHARKYMGKFVESNFHHYEFLGEHFNTVKGYDAYVQKAAIARQGGLEGAVAGFMQAAICVPPTPACAEAGPPSPEVTGARPTASCASSKHGAG